MPVLRVADPGCAFRGLAVGGSIKMSPATLRAVETAWQLQRPPVSNSASFIMRFGHLSLTLLVALNLCAQQGDAQGETQTPRVPRELIPPAHVVPPEQALKSFKLQ